uniref:Uncharacterized protein n=1 Tax=Lepeophtheirus salmonis TaxID=72036 RepID=A0A0K2UUZ6_LEPSM
MFSKLTKRPILDKPGGDMIQGRFSHVTTGTNM